MVMKTQGTDLYALNPFTGTVIDVGCITSIDGVDTTIDQIETTCLNDNARTYVGGLATPGTATFGINFDSSDANQVLLHQLKTQGVELQWAIGFSDGVAPPTATGTGEDAVFTLPDSRTWLTFVGYMSSFPFSFAQNAVVTSSIGIQISGDPILTPKDVTP